MTISSRLLLIGLISLLIVSSSVTAYLFVKTLNSPVTLAKTTEAQTGRYHIILIPEEMNNPYWESIRKGAMKAGSDVHIQVEFTGPAQTNEIDQIKIIEKAIAAKADGIITQGIDNPAFKSVVEKAAKRGIPVVTIDTDAPDSRRAAYVGSNNYHAGFLAGEALLQSTDSDLNVGIITGNDHPNEKERVQGFKDAVKNHVNVQIKAVKTSNISRVQAAEKTYDLLQKYPDINAFYGTSALDALGIAAMTSQFSQRNKMMIVGFDTLPETLDLIKKGQINATITQEPYQMGYESMTLMNSILRHESFAEINNTPSSILTKRDLISRNRMKNINP